MLSLIFLIAGAGFLCLPFVVVRKQDTSLDGSDFRRADNQDDVAFETAVAALEDENPELRLAAWLTEHTESYFGWGAGDRLVGNGFDRVRLEHGRRLYRDQCQGCHGESGDGAGPAARWLMPRPRNFRKGKFKFTSTASGERPLPADLFRSVTNGLAGSAMPSFRLWGDEARWAVVEYVRYLAMRGEFQEIALQSTRDDEELPDAGEIHSIVRERWDMTRLKRTFPAVPETQNDAASVERGRVLFNDLQRGSCFSCHGVGGRGDGPTADDYKDDWGYPIRPRDFGAGVFRAGDDPQALYTAIATGIKGTPMGSFASMFSGAEIWDLVHFAQSVAATAKSGSAAR